MHDSKVGVVALYKCFSFWENLPLDGIFYSYWYFVLHTYQMDPNIIKMNESNYHQLY